MKGTHSGEPGTDWQLGKGPYAFTGTPSCCTGDLILVNRSDDKVKVRGLTTAPPTRSRRGWTPLARTALALEARIPPHGETIASAALRLDPHTPPGRYQATVVCGRQKERVEVEIQPDPDLEIEPTHFQVHGAAGERITRTLVLHNRGNLPIPLGDVAMIWLRERNWIGRTLVYTLRETEPRDNYEDFANRLLHNLRSDLVVPTRISLAPKGSGVLVPGQRLERTLSLTLPRGIRKGRQYLGFIKINRYRVWMELYCDGAQARIKGDSP